MPRSKLEVAEVVGGRDKNYTRGNSLGENLCELRTRGFRRIGCICLPGGRRENGIFALQVPGKRHS